MEGRIGYSPIFFLVRGCISSRTRLPNCAACRSRGSSSSGSIVSNHFPFKSFTSAAVGPVLNPTRFIAAGPNDEGGYFSALRARMFQNVSQAPLFLPSAAPPPHCHSRVPSPASMSVNRLA